jgi:hypothetical protein|tara:strand:+ start:40 stop:240 length:201 start_codon:yes stop_codon:yes gene_type:complete
MKIGDLIEMRNASRPAYECPKAWETGVLIECVAPNARKVALWSVLFGNGKLDKVWSSDMQVISESR